MYNFKLLKKNVDFGIKHGIVKWWCGSDCLRKREQFLKSNEILLVKEFTIWDIATTIDGICFFHVLVNLKSVKSHVKHQYVHLIIST